MQAEKSLEAYSGEREGGGRLGAPFVESPGSAEAPGPQFQQQGPCRSLTLCEHWRSRLLLLFWGWLPGPGGPP